VVNMRNILGTTLENYKTRIFAFVVDYKRQYDGVSPTNKEIRDHIKCSSSDLIVALDSLIREGRLQRNPKQRNSLMVPGATWTYDNG